MSNERDITHSVERLDAFEERMGVQFEALSAWFGQKRGYEVFVCGELHLQSGTRLKQDLEIVADAYDLAGRLVGTATTSIQSAWFLGYETFEIEVENIPTGEIGRIRVYPRAR